MLGALVAAQASAEPVAGPPSVLLVTVDTLRWDHVGAYGAGRKTPTLDAIAAAGARFERAYATAPVTLPSHASMMTGLYPFHHGVRANGFYRLDDGQTTLAERLKAMGYTTGAFVSGFPLEARFGLAQGFDVYDDDFTVVEPSGSVYEPERPAGETVAKALAFLDGAPEPWFVWVHVYDPHAEYEPPEPWRTRHARSPYDGEIAYADDRIGQLWRRVATRLARTIVVVAGDHGESLGEHGEQTHTIFVYDATMRVPFLVAGAGVQAGRVLREPASLVDVAPTILGLAGQAASAGDGRDHASALRGRDAPATPPRRLYFESYVPQIELGWSQLLGLQEGPLKYVHAPRPELYDVLADPGQLDDLALRRPAEVARLSGELSKLLGADPVGRQSRGSLDAEAMQKLRSLGYLQGDGSAGPLTGGDDLPDPKDMIRRQPLLDNALRLLNRGKSPEAAAALRAILKEDPGNPFASQLLASALLAVGDPDGALAALRDAAARATRLTRSALLTSAGDILRIRGDHAAAERELRKALELHPENVTALTLLGLAQLAAGKAEAAEASLRGALRLVPEHARAHAALGDVALHAGRLADARRSYEAAATDVTARARAQLGLAVVAAGEGRKDEAVRQLEALLDGAPLGQSDRDVLHRAGIMAAELTRLDLAVRALGEARDLAPGDATLQRDLGVALSRLGRTGDALAALREARRLAPRDAAIANALGTAFARAQSWPDAIAAFEDAVALDPGSAMARENLAAARAACPAPCPVVPAAP